MDELKPAFAVDIWHKDGQGITPGGTPPDKDGYSLFYGIAPQEFDYEPYMIIRATPGVNAEQVIAMLGKLVDKLRDDPNLIDRLYRLYEVHGMQSAPGPCPFPGLDGEGD